MDPKLKDLVTDHLFGRPLVNNVHRGVLVEAMISRALAPDWVWCSEDWAPFDFQHTSGRSLEVKQSSSLQSWSEHEAKEGRGDFDIAPRKYQWVPDYGWLPDPQRADIYILAWHTHLDRSKADHRDPSQWLFMIIPSADLPMQKTIRLSVASKLSTMARIDELSSAVARVLHRIS